MSALGGPLSPDQYIEKIGVVDYIRAGTMDPTTATGVVPGPEVTELSVMVWVESMLEATPNFQHILILGCLWSTRETWF